MKNTVFLTILLFLLSCNKMASQNADTISISNFGARPYSYENNVAKIQAAIDECKRTGAKVLSFENGRYDIWPEGATRKEYFISNTSTEEECPSKVKSVGLMFDGLKDLTIDGNGATLMFHGEMTTIALEHCENIRLQNMHVDFRYEIVNGRMNLYGEGWCSDKNHCIQYNPQNETFTYCHDWNVLAAADAQEIAPQIVRFVTPAEFRPRVGNTLTIRDIIRDQVGMFILESKDITLNTVIDANRPVHRNVRIENNVFKTLDYPVLYAKSTAQLSFKDNTIIGTKTLSPQAANTNTFYLNGCKDVVIRGNSFEDYTPKQLVKMENMKNKHLKIK